MRKLFDQFLVWLKISGSDSGSRWRNFVSYCAILLSVILILAGLFGPVNTTLGAAAWVFCLMAVWLFYQIVLVALFKISDAFSINPLRLIRDILISGWFSICAFGFLFRQWGIDGPTTEISAKPIDFYYFSAVTFSTLGYGDFRPSEAMRIPAALEAIFGNLHLGMLAGGIFLLVSIFSNRKMDGPSDNKSDDKQTNTDESSGN